MRLADYATVGLVLLLQAPALVITRPITLGSGGETFTEVTLTNTRSRVYVDDSRPPSVPPAPPVPNRCALDDAATGVIWKIVLKGAAVPAKEITVSDDAGGVLSQVCWSSSGSVFQIDAKGNRTGGGPRTEFLVAGPQAPTRLRFNLGNAMAVVDLAPR